MDLINKYDMIDENTSDNILLEILNGFSIIKPKKPSLLDALTFSPNLDMLKEVDKMKKGKMYLVKSKLKQGGMPNEITLVFGKFVRYDSKGCIVMKKCIIYEADDYDEMNEYNVEPFNYVRYSKKYNFCIDETSYKNFTIYEVDAIYIERKAFLQFSEGINDTENKEEKKRLRYLTNRETQKEIASFLGGETNSIDKKIKKLNKTKKNRKNV